MRRVRRDQAALVLSWFSVNTPAWNEASQRASFLFPTRPGSRSFQMARAAGRVGTGDRPQKSRRKNSAGQCVCRERSTVLKDVHRAERPAARHQGLLPPLPRPKQTRARMGIRSGQR
jgi:hypothetical protein